MGPSGGVFIASFTEPSGHGALYVGVAEFSYDITLEERIPIVKEAIENTGGSILDELHVEVNGRAGYQFIYTKNVGSISTKNRELRFVVGRYEYRLSCFAETAFYSKYTSIFDNFVNFFIIE